MRARLEAPLIAGVMQPKNFLLSPEQIRDLAPGRGSCIATDHITVEGMNVGFMYREEPDSDSDSGWRFFSGRESQDYVDNPGNMEIYDVNTIANYDHAIIPYLDVPPGIQLEREPESNNFAKVDE